MCDAFFYTGGGDIMSGDEKTCVLCGQSCAGTPRTRNTRGQYAHQACLKAENEHRTSSGDEVVEDADSGIFGDDLFDGGMDDLLGDYEPTLLASGVSACPGCGHQLEEQAVVCLGCGYNRETGEQSNTKASKDRTKTKSKAASSRAEFTGNMLSQIILPIVCGCIGGALGAGLWSAVAYYGQIRLGLFAWGVGVLVGVGVNIGSRDTGGIVYGLMAFIIAIASVVGGTYATASLLVHEYLEMLSPEDVSADFAMSSVVVWDVIDEWVQRGEEIPWPRKYKTWEFAEWPDEFSRVIVEETQIKWDAMNTDEQYLVRSQIAEVTRANSEFIEHDLLDESFVEILAHPMNIIYLALAAFTAFFVAARD